MAIAKMGIASKSREKTSLTFCLFCPDGIILKASGWNRSGPFLSTVMLSIFDLLSLNRNIELTTLYLQIFVHPLLADSKLKISIFFIDS